jgi:hypothetical protein
MQIAYVVVTAIAALADGYAASLNFVGADSVKLVADHVQVSQKWMFPLGVLLALGHSDSSSALLSLCWAPLPRLGSSHTSSAP